MSKTPDNWTTDILQGSLESALPFIPTRSQSRAIYVLARFLSSRQERCAFLLKGYAGTGKTSLMKALVRVLKMKGQRAVLLAPTGRAAKVLTQYTGSFASTIHRHIYMRNQDREGNSYFKLVPNKLNNTVFIVDEASMIGNERGLLSQGLLDDLIEHIYSRPTCRLVLLGDEAQLPPVSSLQSPAMDQEHLRSEYFLRIASSLLNEVVRQEEGSAILSLATVLRLNLGQDRDGFQLDYAFGPEVIHLDPTELLDVLEDSYSANEARDIRIICRSNKAANLYNQQIRNRILYHDEQLAAGDLLMVVRNNYLWESEDGEISFIANGELCELQAYRSETERYALDFADLELRSLELKGQPSVHCKGLLSSLMTEEASMPESEMKRLYLEVRADLQYENKSKDLRSAMKKDPWYNALQIKYGYAVTCHKAQGGQWPIVFVDRGYVPPNQEKDEYWRWLYTAVTRATDRLYLIGF